MRNDVGMTDATEETKPEETTPVVIVTRPKRVRRGSPWVFSNEIEMSAATKAIPPGTMVRLQEQSGKPVGAAFFNPHSLIAARVIADDPKQPFDKAYVAAHLTSACALRDGLYAAPFYRLIHAEADGLPGVIVDRYGDSGVVPEALTDYIKGREGYDYAKHGKSGHDQTDFVPDEILDRFCILGDEDAHIERLKALEALGVDQFALYLMHDQKNETLNAYGQRIIPAFS